MICIGNALLMRINVCTTYLIIILNTELQAWFCSTISIIAVLMLQQVRIGLLAFSMLTLKKHWGWNTTFTKPQWVSGIHKASISLTRYIRGSCPALLWDIALTRCPHKGFESFIMYESSLLSPESPQPLPSSSGFVFLLPWLWPRSLQWTTVRH